MYFKTNISIRILLLLLLLLLLFIFLYFSSAWMKLTLCNSSLPCLNKVLLLLLLLLRGWQPRRKSTQLLQLTSS